MLKDISVHNRTDRNTLSEDTGENIGVSSFLSIWRIVENYILCRQLTCITVIMMLVSTWPAGCA